MNTESYFDSSNDFRVTLSVRQRTGRTYLTLIEGMPQQYDLKKILRYIKKVYNCGGTILTSEDCEVIQLTGDQRRNVAEFFVKYNVMDKSNIIVRGF